jgi:PAS domain S-box-containing protein
VTEFSRRPAARSIAAIAAVMVISAAALQAYFGFRTETAHYFESLVRSANIVGHEMDDSLRIVDSILAEITDRISLERWPNPEQVSWLSGRLGALPAIDTALVVGMDGESIGPAINAQGPIEQHANVSQREYFQYFQAHPGEHGNRIGSPFVSRFDNRFSLPAVRPFIDSKGRPKGLVRITLDPSLLLDDVVMLAAIDSTAVTVVDGHGALVAEGGFKGAEFTEQVRRDGLLSRLPARETGTLEIVGATGEPSRLVAYRRLRGADLIALVGMRHAEAYGRWRRETARNGVLAVILCAAIFAVSVSFERRDRQRQALEDKHRAFLDAHQRNLERQVAERTAELQRENEIRARTEAALRASRERLRGITDSLFHGVLVFNRTGHTVFANLAARRLLGVEEQEIEGLPIDHLLQVKEDGLALPFDRSPLRNAPAGGHTIHGTEAVFHIVGAESDLDVSYVCTPLGEESRRLAVMSFRDITDIKKAQWELLQASRLASVGQLASGIAHEINTPIQYIGNNLTFISDAVGQLLAALERDGGGQPDEKTAFLADELPAAIAESLDGVAHITRIVLSMKEFSHPGSASKSLIDINRALDTTLTVSTNVWKHVATVEKRFDPDLPPVPCLGGEMNQVFLNLIVNAAHAIEASGKPLPGRITLSTANCADHVEIVVADSGTGIPPAIRDKIFDPFFTTKDVGKGTGQGLAICRDVVIVKHGGSIRVEGAEGEGAVFVIGLPLDEMKGAA